LHYNFIALVSKEIRFNCLFNVEKDGQNKLYEFL